MPKYQLFAARDGNVLRSETYCEDEVAAQRWSLGEIRDKLDLAPVPVDFEEVLGECDGVWLREVVDPLDRCLAEWARAQLGMLDYFTRAQGARLAAEREACFDALMTLFKAIRKTAKAPHEPTSRREVSSSAARPHNLPRLAWGTTVAVQPGAA